MRRIIALLFIVTLLCFACSCDLERKLEGVEIKFKEKIDNATELSFSAYLKTESDGETDELNVYCYKSSGEYAYQFKNPNDANAIYRRLYADNKLYEFLDNPDAVGESLSAVSPSLANSIPKTGTYYVTDAVAVSSTENFLYQIEKNILLATYATLVLDGKKENLNGTETYRYDLTVDGNTYSLWYDDANLIKIAAVINTSKEDGTVTTDKYEATFSDYKFAEIDKTPFSRPTHYYIESPIPFESWMEILGDFGSMSLNWLK